MSDDDILAPESCATGMLGRERGFHHLTLFHSGDDGFVNGTLPFIAEALTAEEPILVAVGSGRIALLKEALSYDSQGVQFTDMQVLGSNPARIIPAWRRFLDEHAPEGRSVRGIGEPIWPGRSEHELTECQRHESLLNVAFDHGQAWSLLCPYDVDALEDEVILAAHESHPFIAEYGAVRESAVSPTSGSGQSVFDGVLPDPVTEPVELEFTGDELGALRHSVARIGSSVMLPPARVDDLVLAVNELASNSIYHGGGVGKLRIWRDGETLLCEVRDRGRITEPLVGRVKPAPEQWTGRGLWLVNQVCDLTQIRSDAAGSVVRVHIGLA
ncbi:MAG: putative signal transduction histidine kinase [Solirubrobacterales bacterium]|nr:putative signal transduction histidine kinase [Solirubrobacterales bacterium]